MSTLALAILIVVCLSIGATIGLAVATIIQVNKGEDDDAALTQQQEAEPVAYISHTSEGDILGWEHQFDAPSHTPLYPTPQPTTCIGCEGAPGPENSPCAVCGQRSTPNVTALVEALECALETMENVDGENDCSRGIDAVEEALAAHHKGEEGK